MCTFIRYDKPFHFVCILSTQHNINLTTNTTHTHPVGSRISIIIFFISIFLVVVVFFTCRSLKEKIELFLKHCLVS